MRQLLPRSEANPPGVGTTSVRSPAFRRFLPLALSWFCLSPTPTTAGEPTQFQRDILPILSDNCFACHGPDAAQRKADLRLDLQAEALRTGDHAVIRPGHSGESELIRRMTSADPDEVMPPPDTRRALTANQVALFRRWIDEGAHWSEHWAFEPPARPEPPHLQRWAGRVRNPIDRFILARLEREELEPSAEADRRTLIRRLSLDLTGLPPAPGEVKAFLADASPDAYDTLVSRLLEEPAYGERMAWDWLDAARYADSNGYQGDQDRTMWPWRDWVVDAFNRNLPYDQFTVWQLAGDLLPGATTEQTLATGFCRNHMINGEGGRIPEENRVDYVMDMMETTGTLWMGLTLNCCRCHDHKYDPLTSEDYYSFYAFFNQTPVDGGGGNPQTPPLLTVPDEARRAALDEALRLIRERSEVLAEFEKTFAPPLPTPPATETGADQEPPALPKEVRRILDLEPADRNAAELYELEKHFNATSPEFTTRVRSLREARDKETRADKAIPRVMVMADRKEWRPTFMLDKGLYDKPGKEVFARVPRHLPPLPDRAPTNRLGLAQWLVARNHPLTARVTVNHFWQQFFGAGLVKTPENFGVQGEYPVHDQLLDWLAVEFMDSGWDVKALCRLMVTSATYRQSSRATAELLQRDPQNRLLARAPRFRMPSWMIRDQALAAAGLLSEKMGGPPVRPYQPDGVWADATFGNRRYQPDSGEPLYRRSLYVFWRRIVGPTLFFDSASRQVCSVKQPRTNTPLHALATLNDVTYVEAARALAERVLGLDGLSPSQRIAHAFQLVLARPPSAAEQERLVNALERLRKEFETAPDQAAAFVRNGESAPANTSVELAAYAALCTAILNLDETLTRE